jgi:hypothetical protein
MLMVWLSCEIAVEYYNTVSLWLLLLAEVDVAVVVFLLFYEEKEPADDGYNCRD